MNIAFKILPFLLLATFKVNAADSLAVEVSSICGPDGYLQYGMMPIEVQIKNIGNQDATIVGFYPEIPGLRFSVSGIAGKQLNFYSPQRQRIPITIKPSEHYSFICYLTDFFEFYDHGKAQVVWSVSLPSPNAEDESAKDDRVGSFSVEIRPDNESETVVELERALSFLNSVKAEKNQRQYISGICSVHRRIVVPFLGRLLGSSMMAQRAAVMHICSEWMDDPRAYLFLDQFLDTTSDGDLANLIVQTYVAHHHMIERIQLTNLLTNTNVSIQYAGLWYSRQIMALLDLKSLSAIASGKNLELSNQANALLQDAAHKDAVPLKMPPSKNQQDDKNAPSGF